MLRGKCPFRSAQSVRLPPAGRIAPQPAANRDSGRCAVRPVQRPLDLALRLGGKSGEREALVGRPHHQAGAAGKHRMVNHLILFNGTDFAQLVGAGAVEPARENAFLGNGHDRFPSMGSHRRGAVRPHKVGGRNPPSSPAVDLHKTTRQKFHRLFKSELSNSEQSGRVPPNPNRLGEE